MLWQLQWPDNCYCLSHGTEKYPEDNKMVFKGGKKTTKTTNGLSVEEKLYKDNVFVIEM